MTGVHDAAARGFTEAATSYSRGRPGYPQEIVKWLQTQVNLAPGTSVLELGAGTGKFTRDLALTRARVFVVEPVLAMRMHLLENVPTATAINGSAESIELQDSSVDAVVCAQAFHWFATRAALTEIARVLKPRGVLGLVWNMPDDRVPWVSALESLLRPLEDSAPHAYRRDTWRNVFPDERFSPLEVTQYQHMHPGNLQRVVIERVRSLSYVANLPPHEQAVLIDRVKALLAGQFDMHPSSQVEFPYRTHAYHCQLAGEP